MSRKTQSETYSKKEAQLRFEAALRGSRIVGPNPPKTIKVKRGRPASDDDLMPNGDAEALVAWGKRNIQKE